MNVNTEEVRLTRHKCHTCGGALWYIDIDEKGKPHIKCANFESDGCYPIEDMDQPGFEAVNRKRRVKADK